MLGCCRLSRVNSGSYVKDLETPSFDDPKVIEALQFFYDMVHTWKLLEIRGYGEASEDFLAGDTAIMYNSTGSMAFVRDNAYFDWSVGPLPGTLSTLPLRRGGLYLFKGILLRKKQLPGGHEIPHQP